MKIYEKMEMLIKKMMYLHKFRKIFVISIEKCENADVFLVTLNKKQSMLFAV